MSSCPTRAAAVANYALPNVCSIGWSNSGRSNYVRAFLGIIAFLIALIACGSALLIYNAFAISIRERKKQFGMFASVGATSVQIRRIVLTEAGVIAAIGIPLGILGAIAGVAILVKLTQGIVSQLILDAEQGMPLVVSPLVIGLTVLFSTATILLSAWIPARRASRVSPIDAIRQSGDIQEGKPLNLRTSPLIRRVFGFEGELALKSLQRDRKKYLTTLLSLMMSIILFVAFNALRLYTDTTTRLTVQAMDYDLQIDLDYRQSHAKDFANLVSQLLMFSRKQIMQFRQVDLGEVAPVQGMRIVWARYEDKYHSPPARVVVQVSTAGAEGPWSSQASGYFAPNHGRGSTGRPCSRSSKYR